VLEGQLGAAPWTETPRALGSGSKPGRLTADEAELGSRHAEPRDERRASGSTTDRTMAVCFVKGSACCLITDPSAKASALEHSITCRFLHDRSAVADCWAQILELRSARVRRLRKDIQSKFTDLTFFPRRTWPARVSASPPARRLPYVWPPTRDGRKGLAAAPTGRRKTDP
jgi:hypothetical protein